MKTKRSHPYRISNAEAEAEAEAAGDFLRGAGPFINRLQRLLKIRTGKSGTHPIGQGFRNDITKDN
jgi:hypothetical protein